MAAGMALLAQRARPTLRLLYDADGLLADERVDFSGWNPDGRAYRTLRAIEDATVERADALIARTSWAVGILGDRAKVDIRPKSVVVTNGRDERVFNPSSHDDRVRIRKDLGVVEGAPLVTFVGSITDKYLPDRLAELLRLIAQKHTGTHVLLLTPFATEAKHVASTAGLASQQVTITQIPHHEVPGYVAASDVGIALIAAAFSTKAVSAVKVGEYLLCGTPVVASRGFGDIESDIDEDVGHLVNPMDDADLERTAAWVVHEVLPDREGYRMRCRERGVDRFSLNRSVTQYEKAFRLVQDAPMTRSR